MPVWRLSAMTSDLHTASLVNKKVKRRIVGGGYRTPKVGLLGFLGVERRECTRLLQECFESEDHAEGVAAFLERRPAQFTGR